MTSQSRGDLVAAMNVLVKRRASTADAPERDTIDEALDKLAGWVQDLNQAELLEAARIVALASDELEKVVASARMGPFDNFLIDLQGVIDRLQNTQGAMHALESLPSAPIAAGVKALAAASSPVTATASAAAPQMALPVAGAAPLPKPANSKVFDDLRAEYVAFFKACVVRPEFKDNVAFYTSRLVKFQSVYTELGASMGIPWFFIGVIHGMECGFNFTTHLHNGDPLAKRTVQVPRGRPLVGEPPFAWRDSARDALVLKGYDKETDWSVPHMLYLWEKYNGFGYRPLGVPSPYLWSFSNVYSSGKFVADHQFDPQAVSKQCGTAVMLKALQKLGAV